MGSQVLTSLRGVIVPPSESISAQVTEFLSTRFVNATVVRLICCHIIIIIIIIILSYMSSFVQYKKSKSGCSISFSQMGYGSTNSALDKHPEFSRTIPTDVYGDSARLLLMKTFGWVRIGVMALEGDTNTRVSVCSLEPCVH